MKERELIGKMVRDDVTGFVGQVTGYVIYKTSQDRVLVEGIDDTGRPVECWFDRARVDLVNID